MWRAGPGRLAVPFIPWHPAHSGGRLQKDREGGQLCGAYMYPRSPLVWSISQERTHPSSPTTLNS